MIYLKKANMEDALKEYEMISQMPEDENGMTNPDWGISYEKFAEEALPRMIRYAEGIGLPEGWVPETHYFLWDDEKIVGLFRLRHYLNDFLRMYHGHIGYAVKRECRGQGYGSRGLALLLEEGKDVIKEEEFYLSLHKDNPASLKVQQRNGARIVREYETNYYTRISKTDRK